MKTSYPTCAPSWTGVWQKCHPPHPLHRVWDTGPLFTVLQPLLPDPVGLIDCLFLLCPFPCPQILKPLDPESTFRVSALRSSEKCSASLTPLDSAQLLFPLRSHLSSSCAPSSSSHRGQRGSRAQGQAEKRKWMSTGLSLPWGQKPGVSPGKAISVRRPPGHYFKTA